MNDEATTRDQLIAELNEMRGKVAELESRLRQATASYARGGTEHEMLQDEIEKRTLLEHELDDAERLYKTLVETAKDVIWTIDLNLRYMYVSPSVTEALGYTVEEIMALRPLDILTPDSQATIIKAFQEELALEASGPRGKYTSRTEEIEQYHKDGSTRWEEITTTFLRDRLGRPIGIFGISHDITERRRMEDELRKAWDELEQRVAERTDELLRANTRLQEEVRERKQAEDELRVSEQRLELVLHGADLGLWDWQVQSGEAVVNRRAAEIIGYALEEIRRSFDFWADLLHPEDRIRAVETVYTHLEGRSAYYEDKYRVKAKSGEWRWIFSRGKVVERDLEGKPLRMAGTYLDITDSKIAEDELRQSRERLSLALEGASLGIWEWDLNTGKALWDEVTLEVLGYEPGEIEPDLKNWKGLVHPEDWPRVSENLNLHIEGQLPIFEVEYRLLDRAKTWRWLHARGKVVEFDATEMPTRMTGIISDITDRKKAEEALSASEKAHKTLAENIPGIVYRVHFDDQPTMEFFNHEVESITGFSEDELKSGEVCSIDPLILSEDRPKVVGLVKQAFHENTPFEIEYRIRDKKGAIRYFLEYGRPIRGSEGSKSFIDGVIFDNTDRKRAEEALRVSEDKFSKAFHASPDVLVISRRDTGQIIETNEKWESTFGYKRDEAIGRTSLELGLFENPEVRSSLIRQLQEQGFIRDYEVKIRRRSGEIRRTLLSGEAIEIGGEPCMLTIIRDITDRKRAEEALRESEARYRYLVENIEDLICTHDLQGNLLFVSSGPAQLLGSLPTDMVGTNLRSYLAPEVRDQFDEYLATIQREGRASGSMLVQNSSGERRVWEYRNSLHTEPGAAPIVLGVARDVTERRRAEQVERRLATAINQATEGVLITNTEGVIQYVNPGLERMTGYSRDELLGQTPRILKSGEHNTSFYSQLWNTIRAGNIWTGRFTNRRKDGQLYYEDATITPVKDASGKILNFVAVKRDITDHLKLSQQLLQAQKMEAVGTLAGGVAHDFNNILQVALGYSELILSDEELPGHYREDLQKIQEAARRGADLVQRLLTFSRKKEIKPQPLNLNRRITELRKMLERTIPKMIDIQLFLGKNLATINADPPQIDQVLMNLAVNARDAMPEGGQLIVQTANILLDEEYARTHVEAKPGHHVLLMVKDTGSGMDKDTLEHIFEPFYTTKGVGEGTGLGLAMVHGIVKQHGGHVTCYSEPGEGTTFRIHFPALISDEGPEEELVREMPPGGTEIILLVDDEEFIRDLGSRILTKAGYEVITACNGTEAVEVYQRKSGEIALVLLDLMMPEMGGKQCLEELLKINPEVKALIASGFAVKGDTKAFLDTEAKGIVPKPFNMMELLRSVRHVLDGI